MKQKIASPRRPSCCWFPSQSELGASDLDAGKERDPGTGLQANSRQNFVLARIADRSALASRFPICCSCIAHHIASTQGSPGELWATDHRCEAEREVARSRE